MKNFTITAIKQPEVSPVQTFYGWFSDEPTEFGPDAPEESNLRSRMIAFQSYLTIDEARLRAMEYAIEHGFNGFILLTAREIAIANKSGERASG